MFHSLSLPIDTILSLLLYWSPVLLLTRALFIKTSLTFVKGALDEDNTWGNAFSISVSGHLLFIGGCTIVSWFLGGFLETFLENNILWIWWLCWSFLLKNSCDLTWKQAISMESVYSLGLVAILMLLG